MRTETLAAIEFAERTDPGRDPNKQVNEDACGHRQTAVGFLSVVCDGMGGHEGGREASQLALRTIFDHLEVAKVSDSPPLTLRAAIEEANRRVFALPAEQDGGRPGATVVAILHHAHGTEVAHVGDSRALLIHAGNIVHLTRDHSMVQQMVDAELITAEQAVGHPDANKISRALGMKADVDVEIRPHPVAHVAGDVFVLCSDGLSDLVTLPEILRIAGGPSAPQAAGQLVELANARGGHDNITVQIVRVRASAATSGNPVSPTVVDTEPPPPMPESPRVESAPLGLSAPHHGPSTSGERRISSPRTDIDHETEPNARRSRVPVAVVIGIVLGALGLLLAGITVYTSVFAKSSHRPALIVTETGVDVVGEGNSLDGGTLEVVPLPRLEPVESDASDFPALDPAPSESTRRHHRLHRDE